MVLVDPTLAASVPGRPEKARPAARTLPLAALARLSELRGEAGRDLGLLRFLARAPQACLILLVTGTGVLLWTRLSANSASLEKEFVWVSSVLAGIAAITGLHILGYARGASSIPLPEAAARLRRLLFYTGAAWGAGAFLVMPDLPAPSLTIGFAVLPSLALGLRLGDWKGATAFTAPVTLGAASAASLAGPSGPWAAAVILAAGLVIFCLPMLQREISSRRDFRPVPTSW